MFIQSALREVVETEPSRVGRRERLRKELAPGFYIALKKSGSWHKLPPVRVLHKLGACFRVPGEDYKDFEYHGLLVPDAGTFRSWCKVCAKSIGDPI